MKVLGTVIIYLVIFTSFCFAKNSYFSSPHEELSFRSKFNIIYEKVKVPYEEFISNTNPKLTPQEVKNIAQSIIFYTMLFNRGEKTEIDPRLIVSIIYCESKFKPNSVSQKGARGLGQIMPNTAKHFNTPDFLFHPVINIYGTVKIFRNYLNRYQYLSYPYQLQYALAAYNAGPTVVEKYGGIPPFRETHDYVLKVIRVYQKLAPDRLHY